MLWLSLTYGGGSDAANVCAVILLFLARTAALGFNQSLWVLSCEVPLAVHQFTFTWKSPILEPLKFNLPVFRRFPHRCEV